MSISVFNGSVNLPFNLCEMTGKFVTKAKQTVSSLSHILFKMKRTKHSVPIIFPQNISEIVSMLSKMRNQVTGWSLYCYLEAHLDEIH